MTFRTRHVLLGLALLWGTPATAGARRAPVASSSNGRAGRLPQRPASAARIGLRRTIADLRARLARQSTELGEIAGGIEHGLAADAAGVAERMYVLEVRALDSMMSIANLPADPVHAVERTELLEEARALVRRVLHQKDHVVAPHAIAAIRAAIPGEPMARVRGVADRDVYEPLDRAASMTRTALIAPRSRELLLEGRWKEFVASGGKPSDIQPISRAFLRGVASDQRIYWAHRATDDKLWVSTRAKHVVLGGGDDAFGAGELKLWKDKAGEVVLAALSNSSGSIKSGAGSLEAPLRALGALGIPAARILLTTQTPTDPAPLRLLLISDGKLSSQEIDARLARARARAEAPEPLAAPTAMDRGAP